jgi:hypothetical protein
VFRQGIRRAQALLLQLAVWVTVQKVVQRDRLVANLGESTSVSHAGWLVVALLLVVVFLIFALGPGQTWLKGLTSGITNIQPPTIPTT